MHRELSSSKTLLAIENLVTSMALGMLFVCFALPSVKAPLLTMMSAYLYNSATNTADLGRSLDLHSDGLAGAEEQHIDFVSDLIRSYKAPHHEAEHLAAAIVSECSRADYDPIFVSAVVHAESTFKNSAVSHRGAQGLMQIMPETGRFLSKRENISWSGINSLRDPKTNLRLGIAYLKYLEKKFNGNRERALIAYNWGPGNVEQALRAGSHIPTQSVSYARKILSTHRKWKSQLVQMAANIDRTNGRFIG